MRALGPSTPLTFGLVKNKNKTPTSSASPTSPVSPVRAAPASPTYALSPPSPSARSFPVFPPLSPSSPAKRFFQEQTFLEPTNPEPEPTTPEPTKLEPTIPEPTILEPVKIPVIIPSIPIIMSTGTLAIKVLKVEAIHEDADANKTIQVKIKIANEIKTSKQFQVGHDVDLPLNFDLNGADADSEIVIEAHTDASKKKEKVTTMAWKVKLSQFLKHTAWVKTGLNSDHYKIHVESKFTAKNTTQKLAGEGAAHAVDQVKETAASLVTLNPQRTLAVSETHRPWFLRAAYYYDTTKNVYNYTTSFRVIAPVARFGENTANTILQKVTGKTLADLDGQLVSPSLNTIDNTVDATISTVLVKLVQGQTYVLKKKDDAISTASGVLGSTLTTAGKAKDYTTSTVSGVVGSTLSTVGKAKDYTTSSVKSVTTSTYNTVASVTDYTSTQVVNVSSSAFGKVRGATVYLASHVPYLGAKIRA